MLKHLLCLVTLVVASSLVFYAGAGEKGEKDKKSGAEQPKYTTETFVPTADEVIAKMFEMGKVGKNDIIFDLGCGDGRLLYQAATKLGARGVGVELNPVRIKEAMDQYVNYGGLKKLGTLVEIRHGDALQVKDISDATVVLLYMFPEFLDLWFPIAQEKLKPGTRILSHDYSWTKGWDPVKTEIVKSNHRDNHKVIMWVVPEKGKDPKKTTSVESR
jgi:cyclopropane fatty-acyl-phospholipid synthase-like methyltransferase